MNSLLRYPCDTVCFSFAWCVHLGSRLGLFYCPHLPVSDLLKLRPYFYPVCQSSLKFIGVKCTT